MIVEILVELILMECGFRVLALFVSSRLLRVEISRRRLLALAGIILFAAIVADILGSEFLSRGLARQLLEEAIQVAFLAAGLVWIAQVRLPRSIAAAIATSLSYRLLLIIIEAIWALIVFGGSGPQSALDPAGRGAERIADLFGWMAVGAVLIWLAVAGLGVWAVRAQPEPSSQRKAAVLIIGGGAALPTLVLAALLAYGLALLPDLLAPAPAGSLEIAVSGEQWWWRVRYLPPDGGTAGIIELANEIRLPVGEPVQLRLDSPDVIHSFWIPSLGGKVDMIPGRRTRLALEPTRVGVFRGVCAEYCGTSHALMSFGVVVLPKQDFARWLAQQREPARPPVEPLAARGRELFLANGCSACHTIRGTPADGVVGPDLTHVGSRLSLGAGILSNEPGGFLRWIARTDELKPEVHMPAFGMLPSQDLQALAAYLDGLE